MNNWSFGVYLRLSNINDNSNSINNQRLVINNFLEKKLDIEIYNIYIDEGFTGTNFDRPAFKALLEDIKLKRINGVIVKDLSRFGRNYISVGTYIDEFFPANNIRFISINDNIDTLNTLNHNENITTSFKNIINELYVKDISDKVKATISYKKATGKLISGNTPYGYMINPNNKYQLVIDHNVKDIVLLIFSLYIKGYGINKIVKELNKRNIVSPAKYKDINLGKKNIYWTNTTVHNILTNDVYCGNLEEFTNVHEAIISNEVFNKVQYLLKERNTSKNNTNHKYLFSGFIRCASCKAFMLIKKSNTVNHEIYCSTYKRINEELCSPHYITSLALENLVSIEIRKRIKEIIFLKKRLENIKKYLMKNNVLEAFNYSKDNLKKFIFNGNIKKKDLYEKWKLKIINYNKYLEWIKFLNRYIYVVNALKEVCLQLSSNISSNLENIKYLKKLVKYKDKALSKEMLNLFIEVIYIEEKQKLNIIYKDEDKVLKIKEFVEEFFSEQL